MSAQHSRSEPAGSQRTHTPRALRLTFEYDGDEIRLVKRRSLEKVTPRSDPVDPEAKERASGFWFEIQGPRRRTLYRLVRGNPIETSVEVRPDKVGESPTRVPVDHPRGSFSILVPDLPEAQDVVLFSSPSATDDPKAAAEPASELARFDLRKAPDPSQNMGGKERAS